MALKPVSFKSLQVFTIDDGRPKPRISDMIRIAFFNNPDLSRYNLQDTVYFTTGRQDATVDNAMQHFAEVLDEKFRSDLRRHPANVYLTETEFYVNPRDKEKRVFVTASSESDEKHILQVLGKGFTLFTAKFRPKF